MSSYREVPLRWQVEGPLSAVWPRFCAAAGAFDGMTPAAAVDLCPVATRPADVWVAAMAAWDVACGEAGVGGDRGNPEPAPFLVRVLGHAWELRYGSGASQAVLTGTTQGHTVRLTVEGPGSALESVATRVVAAGGVPWDTTSDWSLAPTESGYWSCDVRPAERAQWLADVLRAEARGDR